MDEDFNPLPKRGMRQYEGYTWDFKAIAHELYRVTKDGGVVVWVVGDPTIDGSESLASSRQKIYFRKVGFSIHDTMIWKPYGVGAKGSHYSYWQAFEYMIVLSKGMPKSINLIADKVNIHAGKNAGTSPKAEAVGMRRKGSGYVTLDTGIRDNVWTYGVGKGHYDTTDHPAPFPEQLANDHIVSWSNPGDLVFDPFLGSGTTAKMAILNNRNFIGSEIAPEYAPIYDKRIADALAQMSKAPRIVESGNATYSIPPLFSTE